MLRGNRQMEYLHLKMPITKSITEVQIMKQKKKAILSGIIVLLMAGILIGAAPNSKQEWEYKIILTVEVGTSRVGEPFWDRKQKIAEDKLNKAGEGGWELDKIMILPKEPRTPYFILKRSR